MNSEDDPLWSQYLNERGLENEDVPSWLVRPDPAVYSSIGFSFNNSRNRNGRFLPYIRWDGDFYMRGQDDVSQAYGIIRYYSNVEGAPKVVSPMGSPLELHFEPMRNGTKWQDLPEGSLVVVCESRIKAAAIHKATGIATIGLSGITTFGSTKRGENLIFKFYPLPWATWKIVLLPDNDFADPQKSAVRAAVMKLAHRLRWDLNVRSVSIATLPFNGDKLGPDDFIVAVGEEELGKVILGASAYVSDKYPGLVERMNQQAYYIRELKAVGDRANRTIFSSDKAHIHYAPIFEMGGEKGAKRIQGYNEWFGSANRNEVETAGYRYGGDEIYVDDRRIEVFNTFRPGSVVGWTDVVKWRTRERRGVYNPDMRAAKLMVGSPWLRKVMEMVDAMVGGEHLRIPLNHGSWSARDVLLSYVKYLIATDRKPIVSIVLWSYARGIGKNVFLELVRGILTSNCTSCTASDFANSTYSGEYLGHRLVMVNEFDLNKGDRKAFLSNYKTFITERWAKYSQKYVASYMIENCSGFIATCNEREGFPSDGLEDRRTLFIEGNATGQAWTSGDPRFSDVIHGAEVEGALEELVSFLLDDECVPWIDFSSAQPVMDEDRRQELIERSDPWTSVCIQLKDMIPEIYPERWAWSVGMLNKLEHDPRFRDVLKNMNFTERGNFKNIVAPLRNAGWTYSGDIVKRVGKDKAAGYGYRTLSKQFYWTPLSIEQLLTKSKGLSQRDVGAMLDAPLGLAKEGEPKY